jgi:translocator protein
MMPRTTNVPKLVAMVLGCEATGVVTGIATRDGLGRWYPTLNKPPFNPPDGIFGPVWTTLFAMMGGALYLVSQAEPEDRRVVRLAKVLFGLQLGLNALWSLIFFGRRSPLGALIEIVFLWLAILATTLAFQRVSRTAALLMLPYLLWVSFAALLNFEIWRRNR